MDAKLVIATTPEEMENEMQFKTLNTRGFVRAETAEYQWYLLMGEASAKSGVVVDEMVRDYLGTMLCRFMTRTELLEQLAAFNFFEHILGAEKVDSVCTQDVADMSLQYLAFFPERSYNRHEPRSLKYVADMGISLYRELAKEAEGKDDWYSCAYQQMAKSFGSAVIVLRSACPRFARLQEQPRKGLLGDAQYLPNAIEAAELGRSLEPFRLMYFQSEESQSPKSN